MADLDKESLAAIAVTRFGLGARPGELVQATSDPRGWVTNQARAGHSGGPAGDLPTAAERLVGYRTAQQQRQQMRQDETDRPGEQARQVVNLAQASGLQEEAVARAAHGANTHAPFRERWVLFWANHFTVSAIKAQSQPLAGPFEREVIRQGAFGRFEDLLLMASTHPGMMVYLDQVQSIGPNSLAAQRRGQGRGRIAEARPSPGLNENLAREILELHTVGVAGGYSQEDVTQFAKALTGWSVGAATDGPQSGKYLYRPQTHEPGARTVLGKTYGDTGGQQALAILKDLARHPSTARHIARKVAIHFVSDTPPPALTAKLERSFNESGGDLSRLARTLAEADEAWAPEPAKFKTPYELIISAHRALGVAPSRPPQILQPCQQLGQPIFRAPSPEGWAEDAASWAAPDALVKRLAWAEDFAAQVSRGPREPLKVAQDALGKRLSPRTASAIISAESRDEALTILFMSPEFQRR